jgi:undecaprenyl pyrophosphate phosphatase UppP
MNRLVLATILITVVYSWDELKRSLLWSIKSILRQKYNPYTSPSYDHIVGMALILATIPANLVYLLLTDVPLTQKLLLLLVELILIGILASVVETLMNRGKHHHSNVIVLLTSLAMGIFNPLLHPFQSLASNRRIFAVYLKHLIFPIIFALTLKYLTDKFGNATVSNNLDRLIALAAIGLIISLTIDFLERYFRVHKLHLFAYFRILLGIVILSLLFKDVYL